MTKTLGRLLEITRWRDWGATKLPFLIGLCFYQGLAYRLSGPDYVRGCLFFAAFAAVSSAYGYLVNDFGDVEIDRRQGKRNAFLNVSLRRATAVIAALLLADVLLALPFSRRPWFLGLWGAWLILSTGYSLPPLRFKERGAVGVLVPALAQQTLPVGIAFAAFGSPAGPDLWAFMGYTTIKGLALILLHQRRDRAGDLKTRTATFATRRSISQLDRLTTMTIEGEKILLWLVLIVLTWRMPDWQFGPWTVNPVLPLLALYLVTYLGSLRESRRSWRAGAVLDPYQGPVHNATGVVCVLLPTLLLPAYLVGLLVLLDYRNLPMMAMFALVVSPYLPRVVDILTGLVGKWFPVAAGRLRSEPGEVGEHPSGSGGFCGESTHSSASKSDPLYREFQGVPIVLSTNSRAFAAYASRFFGFSPGGNDETTATIRAQLTWDDRLFLGGARGHSGSPVGRRVAWEEGQVIARQVPGFPGLQWALQPKETSLTVQAVYRPPGLRRRLSWVVRSALGGGAYQRVMDGLLYYLVYFPLFWWLERTRGWHLLHGAAVELEGRGLIVAGLPGGGKSTLMLALLAQEGARLLSDNLLFYDSEQVYACPEPLRVDPAMLALVPDLEGRLEEAGEPSSHGRRLFHVRPEAQAAHTRPVVLLWLRLGPETRLRPLAPARCLEMLWAGNMLANEVREYYHAAALLDLWHPQEGLARRRLDALENLVKGLACYELQLKPGEHLAEVVAGVIRPLLEE